MLPVRPTWRTGSHGSNLYKNRETQMKKKKVQDLVVSIVACSLLLMMARFAESLIPAAFDPSKFTPSVVEPRDTLYGVVTVGNKVIWMAGSNGKVVRSEDDGKTWSSQEPGIVENLQDIAAWDESRAVAVGNEGVIIVTQDGGKTWQRIEAPRSEVQNKLNQVQAGPAGKGWAVGLMGAVLGTEDFGKSWVRLVPEEDVGWNGVYFADAQNGWVVGEFGRMKRTRDGGNAWEEVTPLVETSLMSIAFRDSQNGVAVGLEGSILTTSDSGDTWTLVPVEGDVQHLWAVFWHEHGQSWVCVGNMGTYVTGDKNAKVWKWNRLSDTELMWHTGMAAASAKIYIVGGSQGDLEDGKWSYTF